MHMRTLLEIVAVEIVAVGRAILYVRKPLKRTPIFLAIVWRRPLDLCRSVGSILTT